MIENQSKPEGVKDWYPTLIYGGWTLIGFVGFVLTVWKHGLPVRMGVVCYLAVFGLSLYFLLQARHTNPTRKQVNVRWPFLLLLSNVPLWVRTTFM
jgi:hypothetical protein